MRMATISSVGHVIKSLLTNEDHDSIRQHIDYHRRQKTFAQSYLQNLSRLQKALRKALPPEPSGAGATMPPQNNKSQWRSMGWGRGISSQLSDPAEISPNETITPLHSSEITYQGAPAHGGSYRASETRFMPDTVKPPGVYEDRKGKQFFVKTGKSAFAKTPQGLSAATHDVRAEHTTHRLYDVLGGPDMGVASVDSRLHSDALGGAEIPEGHSIHPDDGVYLVTPRMSPDGQELHHLNNSLDTDAKTQALNNLDKGYALDALLGGNDMHYGNLYVNPDGKVARLDAGGFLGMHPGGGGQEEDDIGQFWDSSLASSQRAFLPHLALVHQFTGGLNRLSGQDIINQMSNLVDKFINNQSGIKKAIQHHHDPDGLMRQLAARISQMQRTVQLYRDDPELLKQDIMRAIAPGISGTDQQDVFANQRTTDIAARAAGRRGEGGAVNKQRFAPRGLRQRAKHINETIRTLAGRGGRSFPESLLRPLDPKEIGPVDGVNITDVLPQRDVPIPFQFAAQNFPKTQFIDTSEDEFKDPKSISSRLAENPGAVYAQARAEALKQNRAAVRRWFRAQAVRDAIRRGEVDPQSLSETMFGDLSLADAASAQTSLRPLSPSQLRAWRTDGEFGRGTVDDFIDMLRNKNENSGQ